MDTPVDWQKLISVHAVGADWNYALTGWLLPSKKALVHGRLPPITSNTMSLIHS
jgi:hypothetical protein